MFFHCQPAPTTPQQCPRPPPATARCSCCSCRCPRCSARRQAAQIAPASAAGCSRPASTPQKQGCRQGSRKLWRQLQRLCTWQRAAMQRGSLRMFPLQAHPLGPSLPSPALPLAHMCCLAHACPAGLSHRHKFAAVHPAGHRVKLKRARPAPVYVYIQHCARCLCHAACNAGATQAAATGNGKHGPLICMKDWAHLYCASGPRAVSNITPQRATKLRWTSEEPG